MPSGPLKQEEFLTDDFVIGHSKLYGECLCIPGSYLQRLSPVACDISIFRLPCEITTEQKTYPSETQFLVRKLSLESTDLLLELGHGRQLQDPQAQWFQILKIVPTRPPSADARPTSKAESHASGELLSANPLLSFRLPVSPGEHPAGDAGTEAQQLSLCSSFSTTCGRRGGSRSGPSSELNTEASGQLLGSQSSDAPTRTAPPSLSFSVEGHSCPDDVGGSSVYPVQESEDEQETVASIEVEITNEPSETPQLHTSSVDVPLPRAAPAHEDGGASCTTTRMRNDLPSSKSILLRRGRPHRPKAADSTYEPGSLLASMSQSSSLSRWAMSENNPRHSTPSRRTGGISPKARSDSKESVKTAVTNLSGTNPGYLLEMSLQPCVYAGRGASTPPCAVHPCVDFSSSDATTQDATPPDHPQSRTPRLSRYQRYEGNNARAAAPYSSRKAKPRRRRSLIDENGYSTEDSSPSPVPPQESMRLTRSGLRY